MRTILSAAAVALAVAAGASPASAATMTAPSIDRPSTIEKAATRCWIQRGGRRVCRHVPTGRRAYGWRPGDPSGYYVRDAYKLPMGSREWWLQMNAEGRCSRGC